jgi:hypothetical protein
MKWRVNEEYIARLGQVSQHHMHLHKTLSALHELGQRCHSQLKFEIHSAGTLWT